MDRPFLEDRALHAALESDEEALDAALDKLLPGELSNLASAANALAVAANRKSYAKRNLDRYGQSIRVRELTERETGR